MTKKFLTNRLSFVFLSLVLLLSLAIISGGCGSSNSGTIELSKNNNNSTVQSTVLDDEVFDFDEDGVPDVLDFDEVDQAYYGANDTVQGVKIASIPSRQYLRNFKSDASFTAELTAGTEYTIEISESAGISGVTGVTGYAYPIGENIPDVEILNPQGTALNFLDLGTFDENYDASATVALDDDVIELSVYPEDNPYMICYTFTPSVTGSYTINLSNTASDDVASTAADGDFEHATTLFIYKELRDGTDNNEAGYYTRYKFKDEDGNTSATISMTDIIELRKAYNNVIYDTLSVALSLDGVEGEDGLTENDWKKIYNNPQVQAQIKAYSECLNRLKKNYGIFEASSNTEEQEKIYVDYTLLEEDDDEEEDEELEAASVVSVAANNAVNTKIDQEIYGIPYDSNFQLGTGYFGVTGVQATFRAVNGFTLGVPAKKQVVSSYSATFVSSQEDREKLSTTTANASVAVGGFGLGAGYSSTSKFKFGLTSTTFVIHYEEVESGYRVLKDEEYELKRLASKTLSQDIAKFRNKYGDYFVGGYKYGGTYDAFITITTNTTEQLEEVKTKLSASFASSKFATSADIGNTTKETLNKNSAKISIQIKTAGIDVSSLPSIPKESETKTDIMDVVNSLSSFREALKKSSVGDYNPVYVMLKRYTLLEAVEEAMEEQNDDGLIPISSTHAAKILSFNREKMIMDSYYNVIADLTDTQIDAEVRNQYKREYESITDTVGTPGNAFYAESNLAQMDSLKKQMENLSKRLKAVGDRYVFYQILMTAQKKEETCASESDVTKRPFGNNGGYVGQDSFSVSTAVTSDIAAGINYHDFRNQYSGKSWEPTFTASSGYVFCYVNVTANNTHDVTRTADLYCIGRQTASFHFTCGSARWLEWDVKLRSMRFNSNLYPFSGLK